jgi:hypothetical protein
MVYNLNCFGYFVKDQRHNTGVPLLAEAAFAGGTERSAQNCPERVGLSAQLAVQL